MKVFKILLSLSFLILMVGSLIYKNLIAPEDKTSIFFKLGELTIPLFMAFSLFLMFLKKREDNSGKIKLSKEDRDSFSKLDGK